MPNAPGGTRSWLPPESTGMSAPRRHAAAKRVEPSRTARAARPMRLTSLVGLVSASRRSRPSRTGSRNVLTHSGPRTVASRWRAPRPSLRTAGEAVVASATGTHLHDDVLQVLTRRDQDGPVLAGPDEGRDPEAGQGRLPRAEEPPGREVVHRQPVVALVDVLGTAQTGQQHPAVVDHGGAADRCIQLHRPPLGPVARVQRV